MNRFPSVQLLAVLLALPLLPDSTGTILGQETAPAVVTTSSTAESGMDPKTKLIDAECWPQWRGPNRDGIIAGKAGWPENLDESRLTRTWRIELGPSYSGPIVTSDLVFTTETVDEKHEIVRAIDRSSGKERWRKQWEGAMNVPLFARANGDWIRSTPASDGKLLFVAGIRDVLVCLDAASGAEQWRFDFVDEFKTELPAFGTVCSPLVTDEHIYVQAGGGCCKLDKDSGKLVWRTLDDGGGMNGSAFSSPVLADLAGRSQLLVQTREKLVGVDPQSGDVLWSESIPTFRGMNILTPTVWKNSVFTSAYGGTSHRFDIATTDTRLAAEQKWDSPASGYMSSPLVIGDHAYLHLRNQRFTCIDLATGASNWTTKPFGKYWSLVARGDRILSLDERGELFLIRANPKEFELLDRRKISEQPTWAHLAVCGNEIFIRELNAMSAWRWEDDEATGESDGSASSGD